MVPTVAGWAGAALAGCREMGGEEVEGRTAEGAMVGS